MQQRLVMGDEVRRTQKGNNNAYCQDNEISWFDWKLVDQHQELFRFWKELIAFRLRHDTVHRSRYFTGETNDRGLSDLTWHGCELNAPNWDDPNARSLAATSGGEGDEADLHIMINMYWEPLSFAIPPITGRKWYRAIDTSLASPDDAAALGQESEITSSRYQVNDRSVVVLISK